MKMCLCLLIGAVTVGAATAAAPAAQSDELLDDKDVKLVSFVDLDYSPIAKSARVQGVVVVRVDLDEQGRVRQAVALSGPNILATDSIANARKWVFKPNARRRAFIVYDFRLEMGVCHDDSHSLFLLQHFNFASIIACAPVISG